MNDTDPFLPAATGCDAVQQQLSELADSSGTLSPALQAHLDACPECAAFAEQWLAGPPAALAHPPPLLPGDGLRTRILTAARPLPNVVQFPEPPADRRNAWTGLLGRIAACLALAGLAWWLLNPAPTPVQSRPKFTAAGGLAQSVTQAEARAKREQAALQTAVVDGSRHVEDRMAWTMSALQL